MSPRCPLLVMLALCLLAGAIAPARAHDPSLSGIRILYRQDDVVVNVTTHISRLQKAEGRDHGTLTSEEMDQTIRSRLHLRFDGKAFTADNANVIADSANDLLSWQTILPGSPRECEVLSRLYPEDGASRTVVAVVRNGETVQEILLDADHPDLLRSQPKPTTLAVTLRYVSEGIGHIFSGLDHILFVLGLLLLGGTLKSLLRTVTAFTFAHSITLTLAVTGIFHPSSRIVEPLIALSIVAIAVENLRQMRVKRLQEQPLASSGERRKEELSSRRQPDFRPYYAFGFGLIHGFGFAGALAEVGLPKTALGVALASFNVGVEIGQAAIVLVVAPLLAWFLLKRPLRYQQALVAGSLVIGLAGVYWFCSRLGTL